MKTIIAGSRTINDLELLKTVINESNFTITEVICGNAKGVDLLGKKWAGDHSIPVRLFPPKWDELGKKAGIIRNIDMAEHADALIAIWDGKSRGTKHMIDTAKKKNLKVYVHIV